MREIRTLYPQLYSGFLFFMKHGSMLQEKQVLPITAMFPPGNAREGLQQMYAAKVRRPASYVFA